MIPSILTQIVNRIGPTVDCKCPTTLALYYFHGLLVWDSSIYHALGMKILQSCTKPSIYFEFIPVAVAVLDQLSSVAARTAAVDVEGWTPYASAASAGCVAASAAWAAAAAVAAGASDKAVCAVAASVGDASVGVVSEQWAYQRTAWRQRRPPFGMPSSAASGYPYGRLPARMPTPPIRCSMTDGLAAERNAWCIKAQYTTVAHNCYYQIPISIFLWSPLGSVLSSAPHECPRIFRVVKFWNGRRPT